VTSPEKEQAEAKARRSRCREVLKIVAINAAVICAILLAAEAYVRHTATQIVEKWVEELGTTRFVPSSAECLVRETPKGRRVIPNAHVIIRNHRLSKRDIEIRIDSLGFRDREIPEAKPKGEYRILALGDSITWGDYLQADEVYVEQMERFLNAAVTGLRVEVVNAAVGDIGLREEVDILEERGLRVHPDEVLVAFYLNDSRPPWGFSTEQGSRGWLRRHSQLAEEVYRSLQVRKWISERGAGRFRWITAAKKLPWRTERKAFMELASLARYDWGAAWQEDSWASIRRQFARLHALARRHRFDVTVVAFPVAYQVYARFLANQPQRVLHDVIRTFGFRYLDLLPVLRKHADEDLYFDQCHPRVQANAIIGKTIGMFLLEGIPALRSRSLRRIRN